MLVQYLVVFTTGSFNIDVSLVPFISICNNPIFKNTNIT
ncbi:MAG: hypothetical protein JWR76_928 [Mucilaginibacter sp.]|nr:hypothetical protein [Mucilaginibacter sp.]